MFNIQLNTYRIIFLAIGLIGILLFASPTIVLFSEPRTGQSFSEIYILGPDQTFETVPFNITSMATYLVYLGVTNNVGHSSYYTCIVKIGNESSAFPDIKKASPSDLPQIFEYQIFLRNGETWQAPMSIQVSQVDFAEKSCKLSTITINGIPNSVNITSSWNPTLKGFYFNFIIELWAFDPALGFSQFNNRFVSIPLNMTQ